MSYKIVRKEILNPQIFLMEVEAPLVARKAEPGQFIILRTNEYGERVPFTIADFDREKGTVTIIVQVVGKTTQDMVKMEAGDCLSDFAGPLGQPTELEGIKKVAVIGGGLGTAIAYPQAKKLHALGADVTVITGFRNKDLVILEDELEAVSDKLIITTDDGSNGLQGFVTDRLREEIEAGEKFDKVIFCGNIKQLPVLIKNFDIEEFVKPIEALEYHGTTSVFCEIDKNPYSWIYLPDEKTEAHRIICTGNFSESNNAIGKMTATVEFTDFMDKNEIEAELKKTPLNPKYLDHHYNEYTYPIQDHRTKDLIRSLKMKLQTRGFYFTGRFADWEYYNMDIAMGASMDICKMIE